MLRKLFVVAALGLLLVPAVAQAQFNEGDWDVTLFGTGSNNNGFTDGVWSAGGSIGYFLTKEAELGFRQTATYADIADDTQWAGSSRAFLDWHFDLDQFQPFVGIQGGYVYGQDLPDFWEWGPEAGIKYFVNSTTYILGAVEWQINTRDYDDSQFVYILGVGFRF